MLWRRSSIQLCMMRSCHWLQQIILWCAQLIRCLLMCLSRWESLRIVSCNNRSAVTQFESEQVSGATEASWTAAKASVDGALETLDALVAARLRARIIGDLLPALQASQLHNDLSTGREHDKGHLRPAPTMAQPLQVRCIFRSTGLCLYTCSKGTKFCCVATVPHKPQFILVPLY